MFDLRTFNISGTLSVFLLFAKPSLCIPQATIRNFNELPLPINRLFEKDPRFGKVNVRAVVLDKDDCFAWPEKSEVWPEYKKHFESLKSAHPTPSLLIVSNTAGTSSIDPSQSLSRLVTANTGVPVLQHSTKKPGCGAEIMAYFRAQKGLEDLKPSEVVIVGDRLTTDVVLANRMGAYGIWVKDGVRRLEEKTLLAKWERKLLAFLVRRGLESPIPNSQFE